MILGFFLVLAMALAAMGLGRLLLAVVAPRFVEYRPIPVGMLGLAGLGLASLAAVTVNFVAPVTWHLAVVLTVAGLVAFAGIVGSLQRAQWFFLAAAAVVVAVVAPSLPLGSDGGLYHLPAQLWLVEEKAVFGLANLHGRFGFNSLNEVLLSLGWPPDNQLSLARLLSGLPAVFGCALLYDLSRSTTDESDVRYLSIFAGAGLAFASLYIALRVGWLNTDIAPATYSLASVLLGYVALRRNDATLILVSLLFAALATANKGSAITVVLFPLAALAIMVARSGWPPRVRPRIGLITVLMLPWIGRSFVVSGCLFYPAVASCLPVPWAATDAAALDTQWAIAWARAPDTGLVYLTGWSWLPVWFGTERWRLLALIAAAIGGIGLTALTPRGTLQGRDLTPPLLVSAWAVLAVAFWFLSAPAFRFGIAPLLLLAAVPGLWAVVRRAGLEGSTQAAWFPLALMAAGIAGAIAAANSQFQWKQNALLPGSPEVPAIDVLEEDAINWPAAGDKCFLAPRPCATGPVNLDDQVWGGYRVFLPPPE